MVLTNLDFVIAATALVMLIVLTFMGVVMRYVVGQPFTWLEEVQLWCMVWIVFASAGSAFRTGSHVAIEMVVDLFPKNIQRVFEVFISSVVLLVLGYLFYQSIGFVELFIRSGRTTNMLSIPYKLIYGIVPISCLSMIFNYFYVWIKDIKDGKAIQEEERIGEVEL